LEKLDTLMVTTADPLVDSPAEAGWKHEEAIIDLVGEFIDALPILIPIVMVFLSLTLKHPAIRWVTIIAAILLFIFNLIGLPTYPSVYDKFLIVVGLVFNGLTVWYAWKWV
jgi:hypothetical protein